MYLLDTNVFIEGLLGQEKAEEVRSLFLKVRLDELFITDLSIHSIGIILFRLKKIELFHTFLSDLLIDGINIVTLNPEEMKDLEKVAGEYHLDFDDSYQLWASVKNGLKLVSYDSDFDKPGINAVKPVEIN
ncbi:MAG: PIN domain-containing protein [Candidatus Wallbacteria bacterium]|nr:PIN domain-containing protein [Candidatus Wallbacteria bacterium]